MGDLTEPGERLEGKRKEDASLQKNKKRRTEHEEKSALECGWP